QYIPPILALDYLPYLPQAPHKDINLCSLPRIITNITLLPFLDSPPMTIFLTVIFSAGPMPIELGG
ncbi:MAG: hypothetical protein QQN63_11565, partial [Nitrosopumilus sp.]